MKLVEFKKLLASDNYIDRLNGYSYLDEFPTNTSRKYMIQGTKDKHHQVRANIADFMGQSKDEYYVPFLLELLNDKSYIVRFSAADALGWFPEQKAMIEDPLIKALKDKNSTVRICAAESLGSYESKKALIELKAISESDDNYIARTVAIRAIGNAHLKSQKKWLIERIEKETDERVKIEIFSALVELGDVKYFWQVANALKNEDLDIKVAAINSMSSTISLYFKKDLIIGIFESHLKNEVNEKCIRKIAKKIELLKKDTFYIGTPRKNLPKQEL